MEAENIIKEIESTLDELYRISNFNKAVKIYQRYFIKPENDCKVFTDININQTTMTKKEQTIQEILHVIKYHSSMQSSAEVIYDKFIAPNEKRESGIYKVLFKGHTKELYAEYISEEERWYFFGDSNGYKTESIERIGERIDIEKPK